MFVTLSHIELTKSTPIVLKKFSLKLLSAYLSNKHDFPTPEFPINNILNK